MLSHQRILRLSGACHLKGDYQLIVLCNNSLSTHDVVGDGLGATDLVRGGRLVPGGHRDRGPRLHGHQPPGLEPQLLGQHGAGLGLHPAIEVARHVVRHRAVLTAVPLETGL